MILKIAKNIVLIVIAAVAGHFLAVPFGAALSQILSIGGSYGGDVLEYYMFGVCISLTFFICLLFSTFGDKYKFWWTGVALLPVLWLEMQLAAILIIFSAIFGGIGWWLGRLLSGYLTKVAPSFMTKLS